MRGHEQLLSLLTPVPAPSRQVMVANIRCSEIMADQLDAFKHDAAWVRGRTGWV